LLVYWNNDYVYETVVQYIVNYSLTIIQYCN